MRNRRVLAALVVLVLAGCKSKQETYLEQLERDWQQVEVTAPADDAAQIPHFEAFLARYPAVHEFGNPRAGEAEQRVAAAKEHLAAAARDAELVRLAAVRQRQLAPVMVRLLWRLVEGVTDLGRDTQVLHLVEGGVHQVLRGEFARANWAVLRELPLDQLRRVLGAPIYDHKARRYDAAALEQLLAALYLPPETALFGTTAKHLYPVFRRRLRAEWLLYRGLERHFADRIGALEETFAALAPEAGEEASFRQVWHEQGNDRRCFYAYLYYDLDAPAHCGLPPGELTHLDLGFWVRRFEDGTAATLGRYLRRVLAAYDNDWLVEQEQKPPARFQATSVWVEGKQAEFVRLQPLLYGGNVFVVRTDAGETTTNGWERVAFSPPVPPPTLSDPRTGDRLLAEPLPPGPAFYSPDGAELAVFAREAKWFEAEGFTPLRSMTLAGEALRLNRAARTADGALVALAFYNHQDSHGHATLIVDGRTGELRERLDGFVAHQGLAVNQDATIIAGYWGGQEVEVRFRGAADTPVRPPLRLATRGALALHPTLPILISGAHGTEIWDLDTGTRLATLRQSDYASGRAFNADGSRLWTASADGGAVDRFDATAKSLTLERRFPGQYPDGRWLRGGLLWILDQGVARVVDPTTGKTVGRPVRAGALRAASPDGRALLLDAGSDTLRWSAR